MTAFELIAAVFTILGVYLAAKETVWYYPVSIVSVLMYAWLYYGVRLYAEAGLQVVWLVLMIYGWYEWLHGGANRTELPVSRTPRRTWPWVIGTGALLWLAVTWLQQRFTDNPVPVIDSGIAAWAIVAQWLTARKHIETWIFWTAINCVAIPLYLTRSLYAIAAVYIVILVLGIKGYFEWRRSLVSA